jgi:competence protein ComFC
MYKTLLRPLATDVKNFILDTLFPINCVICKKDGAFVCADCRSQFTKVDGQICLVCQKPSPFGLTHPGCQTPHGQDATFSIYNYHDKKVAQVIIDGKYKFLPGIFTLLGKITAERLDPNLLSLFSNPFLVPLPLHKSRQRWRGFNQAEVLCQAIAHNLSLPCTSVPFGRLTVAGGELVEPLVRCKATQTQKDLKREQRLKNMGDAFVLKTGADVHGKNLILIDDVTTTGATLTEACKVLKRNGAAKVLCVTVARD